ncbi:MAG: hypothetical protein OEX07_00775 [Gammaproteobacteria bacterium]|nr:hypothetical protein [Gammaproteobacteria bacterium]
MNTLFWLLLPVAAISGWIAATRHFRAASDSPLSSNQNYPFFSGSRPAREVHHSFIDTQPDKAVDIVIDKVEVTSDTVEVHLALGKLYRRSGEVNRAIRFHQNLSEKHSLSNAERESILYELGLDYLSAGLLDRAERIFKDLLTSEGFRLDSSKALIEVYQQEKDWDAALEYAEMFETLSKISQKTIIGQFYCEKAEKIRSVGNESDVEALLQLALKKDKSCIRAYISLGELSYGLNDYETALQNYMAAVEIDRIFLSVVLENLIHCCSLIQQNENYMTSILPGSASVDLTASSDASADEKSELFENQKRAIKYIEQQLEKSPTLSLLSKYLLLLLDDPDLVDRKALSQIKDSLFKVNNKSASYKCVSCGLGVHALQWQCPSCSSWSTIKPI